MGSVNSSQFANTEATEMKCDSADALLLYATAIESNLRQLSAYSQPLCDALRRLEALLEQAHAEVAANPAEHV